MQTTFIKTPDGRIVQSDIIGDHPKPTAEKFSVSEARKLPRELRRNVLDKIFPPKTKIDLEKNRKFFRVLREEPKKKRGQPFTKSVHHEKMSVPVIPPRTKKLGRPPLPKLDEPPAPPKIITRRKCLSCGTEFNSGGIFHRMCAYCRTHKSAD